MIFMKMNLISQYHSWNQSTVVFTVYNCGPTSSMLLYIRLVFLSIVLWVNMTPTPNMYTLLILMSYYNSEMVIHKPQIPLQDEGEHLACQSWSQCPLCHQSYSFTWSLLFYMLVRLINNTVFITNKKNN